MTQITPTKAYQGLISWQVVARVAKCHLKNHALLNTAGIVVKNCSSYGLFGWAIFLFKENIRKKSTRGKNDNQKKAGHFYEAHAKEHNPKLPTNDVAAAVSPLKVIKAASLSQKSGTTTASSSKRNIFFFTDPEPQRMSTFSDGISLTTHATFRNLCITTLVSLVVVTTWKIIEWKKTKNLVHFDPTTRLCSKSGLFSLFSASWTIFWKKLKVELFLVTLQYWICY